VSLAFNNHCRKSTALFGGTSLNASPTPELEFAYATLAVAAKHSDSAKILITTSLPTGSVFGVSTKHPFKLILATREPSIPPDSGWIISAMAMKG
jgi:hypothetical protein